MTFFPSSNCKEGSRKRAAAKKKPLATVAQNSKSEEEIDLDDDENSGVEIAATPKAAAQKS